MKRILLAYDGGEPAQRALETTAELAKLSGALVSVVSVVPMHPGRIGSDPWDTTEDHAHELLEARRMLHERGIEAELLEPIGDPAERIEEIAEKGDFDTIVVGSRGLGAVGRVLQGSVSEHVATHARTTVIIAR
ncbi:MAG TPA: universal stress protein [Candidatus Acidoferrales bacterium]|jgi:nucleotide-binding universal stress UspA family protein|nr:universal stress protein [Candidatus Acidoferrales bacterium]